jgi:hypothetical protein
MELQTDDLINGLLEEVKRLTLENIAYKAALQKLQAVPMGAMPDTEE